LSKRVAIIKGQSQYDVLRDFADQIGLGFQSLGSSVDYIDLLADDWNEKVLQVMERTEFALSFNAGHFLLADKPFYEYFQKPFLGFLVDHPAYLYSRF